MEWIILALASGVLTAAYFARRGPPTTNPVGVGERLAPGTKIIRDGREWTIGPDGMPLPDGIPRDAAGNVVTSGPRDAGVAASGAIARDASAKRALSAAELSAAQAAQAAIAAQERADEARRGEYANMEQRVREANEARAAAEVARARAEAAAAEAARAATERQAAVERAAAVIREKAPILERKTAELATLRNRIVVNRGLATNVARLRRALADRLERYPEVLRFTYGGPDNLTLVPYAGPVEGAEYGSARWNEVNVARLHAEALGRPNPYPNTRLLTTNDVQIRTQWLRMGAEIDDSLRMIEADENAIAVLTGEVETLGREVTDAQAAIGGGPSTSRVQAGGQEVTTETTIPGSAGATRAAGATDMRSRRAGIRNAH